MELSEAKKELEDLSRSIGPVDSEYLKEQEPENYKLNEAINAVLKALDNSISKDEVQKTFTKHTEEYHKYLDGMERKLSHLKDDHKIRATYAEFGVLKGKVEVLQELLGE